MKQNEIKHVQYSTIYVLQYPGVNRDGHDDPAFPDRSCMEQAKCLNSCRYFTAGILYTVKAYGTAKSVLRYLNVMYYYAHRQWTAR